MRAVIQGSRLASRALRARPMAATASTSHSSLFRYYSSKIDGKDQPNKAPKSLLTDDILASAGIDPSEVKNQRIDKQEAKKSAESLKDSEGAETSETSSSSSESSTKEEQKERWRDTAKKSSNKSSTDIKREKRSNYFYAALLGAVLGGSVYLGRDWDQVEEKLHPSIPNGLNPGDAFARFQARLSDIFQFFKEPAYDQLLPDPLPEPYGRPLTLVVGLDDVLIHSEWTREHGWRTAKRPGLDYFLGYLAQYYEIVIFSSNYMVYSEKAVAKLDPYRSCISHALYREATRYRDGKIIKDLSLMNRDMGKIIILDSNPDAYSMQPENAVPTQPWKGTPGDKELVKLIPFLEWVATQPIKDVRPILKSFEGTNIADEYSRREAIARTKFEEEWKKQHAAQSSNWASAFLGVQSPVPPTPMMPQDYIRQEGQKGYENFQQYLKENGEKMLAEEKQREKEILNEQKFTLNKLVVEGLPKPEDIAAQQLLKAKSEESNV